MSVDCLEKCRRAGILKMFLRTERSGLLYSNSSFLRKKIPDFSTELKINCLVDFLFFLFIFPSLLNLKGNSSLSLLSPSLT